MPITVKVEKNERFGFVATVMENGQKIAGGAAAMDTGKKLLSGKTEAIARANAERWIRTFRKGKKGDRMDALDSLREDDFGLSGSVKVGRKTHIIRDMNVDVVYSINGVRMEAKDLTPGRATLLWNKLRTESGFKLISKKPSTRQPKAEELKRKGDRMDARPPRFTGSVASKSNGTQVVRLFKDGTEINKWFRQESRPAANQFMSRMVQQAKAKAEREAREKGDRMDSAREDAGEIGSLRGHEVRYTGKTKLINRDKFFEVIFLDGPQKGQKGFSPSSPSQSMKLKTFGHEARTKLSLRKQVEAAQARKRGGKRDGATFDRLAKQAQDLDRRSKALRFKAAGDTSPAGDKLRQQATEIDAKAAALMQEAISKMNVDHADGAASAAVIREAKDALMKATSEFKNAPADKMPQLKVRMQAAERRLRELESKKDSGDEAFQLKQKAAQMMSRAEKLRKEGKIKQANALEQEANMIEHRASNMRISNDSRGDAMLVYGFKTKDGQSISREMPSLAAAQEFAKRTGATLTSKGRVSTKGDSLREDALTVTRPFNPKDEWTHRKLKLKTTRTGDGKYRGVIVGSIGNPVWVASTTHDKIMDAMNAARPQHEKMKAEAARFSGKPFKKRDHADAGPRFEAQINRGLTKLKTNPNLSSDETKKNFWVWQVWDNKLKKYVGFPGMGSFHPKEAAAQVQPQANSMNLTEERRSRGLKSKGDHADAFNPEAGLDEFKLRKRNEAQLKRINNKILQEMNARDRAAKSGDTRRLASAKSEIKKLQKVEADLKRAIAKASSPNAARNKAQAGRRATAKSAKNKAQIDRINASLRDDPRKVAQWKREAEQLKRQGKASEAAKLMTKATKLEATFPIKKKALERLMRGDHADGGGGIDVTRSFGKSTRPKRDPKKMTIKSGKGDLGGRTRWWAIVMFPGGIEVERLFSFVSESDARQKAQRFINSKKDSREDAFRLPAKEREERARSAKKRPSRKFTIQTLSPGAVAGSPRPMAMAIIEEGGKRVKTFTDPSESAAQRKAEQWVASQKRDSREDAMFPVTVRAGNVEGEFTISASNEQQAILKAKEKFKKAHGGRGGDVSATSMHFMNAFIGGRGR